jgi:hypothetical protein
LPGRGIAPLNAPAATIPPGIAARWHDMDDALAFAPLLSRSGFGKEFIDVLDPPLPL